MDIKGPPLVCQCGVKGYLKPQIAKLTAQVGISCCVVRTMPGYGIQNFGCLFTKKPGKGLMGLLSIPGTTVWSKKTTHNGP